jgi:hypothetical protein
MTASPEAMVLLFDAVMIDDDALLRCLFRRFPLMRKKASELTDDEREALSPAALVANHFYTYPTSDEKKVNFGLVLADTATAKALAGECNLVDYIHWGANTDPVQLATAADIAEVLEASEEHTTPVKVLSLLKEMNASGSVKRVRPD